MLPQLRQFIRSNGSSWPFTIMAKASEKFLRAFYNEGFYVAEENGEERIIDLVVGAMDRADEFVVLDVGAHHGVWTASVIEKSPSAEVFCFEIVSPVRAILETRFADATSVHVLDYGLSSSAGQIEVTHNLTHDSTSSIAPRSESEFFTDSDLVVLHEQVDEGDTFVARTGIERIDLMKIDVEGHEVDVLQGFNQTLGTAVAPRVIQFEYGDTYLTFRHTLREVYELLSPHGYQIGRIYPDRVAFKPYDLSDDHFRMGNYVAVKGSDPLISILA